MSSQQLHTGIQDNEGNTAGVSKIVLMRCSIKLLALSVTLATDDFDKSYQYVHFVLVNFTLSEGWS